MTPDQIAILAMQPVTQTGSPLTSDDVSTAITQALTQGGQQWMIGTVVAFLPALWLMVLILHLGRPYVLRALRRMGLRFGADIWWMSYLLLRDTVLLLTFALSWIFFAPNLIGSMSFPITGPLSALLLLLALAVKLSRRADDDVAAYRLATVFLVLGAVLYFGALVFGVEAADQDYLAGFAQALTSNTNVTVAMAIMWASLVGVGLVAGWLFIRALNSATRTMESRLSPEPTQQPQGQPSAM
jgi:small neutral amino acid transporter SnatA (MarC family)